MWLVMKKFCCEKCFEISDIQNFIKEFQQLGNCDYCGSCNVFILDIKKVGEFILESVKRAYEDAVNHVSYSSRDGGYLMSTYSITEILLEKEEIFSDRLDELRSEELIPDDGTEYVKRDMLKKIIAAWIVTVPVAGLFSAVIFFVIKGIML